MRKKRKRQSRQDGQRDGQEERDRLVGIDITNRTLVTHRSPVVTGQSAMVKHTGNLGRRSALVPGMNLTQTARRIGISLSYLSKILSGQLKTSPSLDVACRLGKAFGLPPERFQREKLRELAGEIERKMNALRG